MKVEQSAKDEVILSGFFRGSRKDCLPHKMELCNLIRMKKKKNKPKNALCKFPKKERIIEIVSAIFFSDTKICFVPSFFYYVIDLLRPMCVCDVFFFFVRTHCYMRAKIMHIFLQIR